MDDDEENQRTPDTLESLFEEYCNVWANFYENPNYGGDEHHEEILLSQSDLWLKNADVIKRYYNIFDTGLLWFEQGKLRLSFDDYMKYIELLSDKKYMDADDIKDMMLEAGPPEEVQLI